MVLLVRYGTDVFAGVVLYRWLCWCEIDDFAGVMLYICCCWCGVVHVVFAGVIFAQMSLLVWCCTDVFAGVILHRKVCWCDVVDVFAGVQMYLLVWC